MKGNRTHARTHEGRRGEDGGGEGEGDGGGAFSGET